jgi:hypothetical protein
MDRWLSGILLAFGVVFAANGLLVWLATREPLGIDPSYAAEAR